MFPSVFMNLCLGNKAESNDFQICACEEGGEEGRREGKMEGERWIKRKGVKEKDGGKRARGSRGRQNPRDMREISHDI